MTAIRLVQRAVRRAAALLILAVCGWEYLEWLRQGFHARSSELSLADKFCALDSPVAGQLVDGDVLEIWGWARAGGSAPDRVEVEIDGKVVALATVGVPRPDTAGFEKSAYGYQAYVSIANCDIGEVTVAVTAVFPNGARGRVSRRTINRIRTEKPYLDRAEKRRAQTVEALRKVPVGTKRSGFLLFSPGLGISDSQHFVLEMVRRMTQEAAISFTIVSTSDGPLRKDFERLGAEVHISELRAPNDPAAYEGRVRELATFIKTSGYGVALLNTLAVFPAADACQLAGVPTVWSIHDHVSVPDCALLFHRRSYGFMVKRISSALHAASALVFEADATSAVFAEYAQPERRLTVPYGVDMKGISTFRTDFDKVAARRRLDIPEHSTVLLCMGILEERRGQIPIAQAFARIADRHPGAMLLVVGDRPGHYSDSLHDFIGRSNLDGRIRLVNTSANPYQWYGVADLLVSASDTESVPRCFFEAMAFDIPVLSTDVFGVPELITESVNGWLCAPRDTAALAVALERVLSLERSEWTTVAAAAHDQVSRLHDSSGYARDYAALLQGFSANPSAIPREILDEAQAAYNVPGVTSRHAVGAH